MMAWAMDYTVKVSHECVHVCCVYICGVCVCMFLYVVCAHVLCCVYW